MVDEYIIPDKLFNGEAMESIIHNTLSTYRRRGEKCPPLTPRQIEMILREVTIK